MGAALESPRGKRMATEPRGAAQSPGMNVSPRPDCWTVAAIAIVAYALASVLHEGAGHGGACLLTGGQPQAMSSVFFTCNREGRLVDAGGTIANLAAGLIFWLASRGVSRAARWRYFLWLSMTINLLQGTGYFLFSGVANIGDWAAFFRGFEPAWLWRAGLTMLGIGSYGLCVWIAVREMRPFLGHEDAERLPRAKRLTLVPYFTGGIFSCVAGMLNPVGMILVAISAAAASFGGTSGLAWMWQLLRGRRVPPQVREMPPLTRSRGWLLAAAVVGALFIAFLGPGLKFHGGG